MQMLQLRVLEFQRFGHSVEVRVQKKKSLLQSHE